MAILFSSCDNLSCTGMYFIFYCCSRIDSAVVAGVSPCTLFACLLAVRALHGLGLAGDCQLSKSLLRQALPTRPCPTTPLRSRAIRGNQGSPSIRHLPGGRARLGHGPVGGPGSAGPMAGQGRAVESWRLALLQPHCVRD